MPENKDDEYIQSSIRNELKRAKENNLFVTIYGGGTYKGITGRVTFLGHGMIKIDGETEDGAKCNDVMRMMDIKRVRVYEQPKQ